MSASASPAAAAGVIHGWTAGRARRAKMFAALLALVAVAAIWSAWQPWYGFATAGAPRCDRPTIVPAITVQTPASRTPVEGVYAAACISGKEIADQFDNAGLAAGDARALSILAQDSLEPHPDVMFGIPRTVTFVVIGCVLGMLALGLRTGPLGLAGVLAFYLAHRDLGSLQSLMTTGPGGALNAPQEGLSWFGYALLCGAGLVVTGTLLVVRHNSDEKRVARALAERAGEPAPRGAMDHVFDLVGRGINKSMDAAATQRARSSAPDASA